MSGLFRARKGPPRYCDESPLNPPLYGNAKRFPGGDHWGVAPPTSPSDTHREAPVARCLQPRVAQVACNRGWHRLLATCVRSTGADYRENVRPSRPRPACCASVTRFAGKPVHPVNRRWACPIFCPRALICNQRIAQQVMTAEFGHSYCKHVLSSFHASFGCTILWLTNVFCFDGAAAASVVLAVGGSYP